MIKSYKEKKNQIDCAMKYERKLQDLIQAMTDNIDNIKLYNEIFDDFERCLRNICILILEGCITKLCIQYNFKILIKKIIDNNLLEHFDRLSYRDLEGKLSADYKFNKQAYEYI